MSRRVQVFKALEPQFQLANRFYVICKLMSVYSFRVHTTEIPFPKSLSTTYYKNGRKFTIPVRKETSGEWSFDVYEDGLASFITAMSAVNNNLQKTYYKSTKYVSDGSAKSSVGSALKSLGNSVLNGVANTVVGMLSNDETRVFRTTFQDVYVFMSASPGTIPGTLGSFNMSIPGIDLPILGLKLKELYLTGISPIKLDSSNTSEPLSLHVDCQYNGLVVL